MLTSSISAYTNSLSGLHSSALGIDTFAAGYAKEGMKAYVEMIQEPERKAGCEVLTHQKWSGAEYMDNLLRMVTGGISSTAAMGKGVVSASFFLAIRSLLDNRQRHNSHSRNSDHPIHYTFCPGTILFRIIFALLFHSCVVIQDMIVMIFITMNASSQIKHVRLCDNYVYIYVLFYKNVGHQ